MPTKKTLEFTTTRGVLLMILTGHHYASYSLLVSLPVPATFWRSELLMGLIRLLWMPASPHLHLQHLFRLLLLINPLHLMLLASQLNTMGSQKTT
jgi:hypothetical protein